MQTLAALIFRIFLALTAGVAAAENAARPVIVLESGHGGANDEADSGSAAAENKSDANHATLAGDPKIKERLLTLELCKRIAALIEKDGGATPVLTRQRDEENPDFTARMATAAKAGATLVVSIHFNSGEVPAANGPVCIYPRAEVNPAVARDKKLAHSLVEAVRETTQRFEEPGFTTHSVCYDDEDMVKQRVNGKQLRPHGSYLFYQARLNPALKKTPVLYLEVDYLQSKRYQERSRRLFVDRKAEVFEAWAQTIARQLIKEAKELPQG